MSTVTVLAGPDKHWMGPSRPLSPKPSGEGRAPSSTRPMRDDLMMRAVIAPSEVREVEGQEELEHERPWLVIVWNDPVNLMSYVTWVFQKLFNYSRPHATKLMLQVHHEGRAVVSSGSREKAELDCFKLHGYGLWATMSKSD